MTEDLDFHVAETFGHRAVVRRDLVGVAVARLWGAGQELAEAKGRGGAAVVELPSDVHGQVRGVVRDYRRGGVLRFLLACSYLDRARPENELRILATLRAAGVPVVEPLAALARRRCLIFHRLRLITALAEGAQPLPAFIAAEPGLRHRAVREAGRVVELAMAAGLLHRDLHPDNIIARRGADGSAEVFLLDLDRAELRPELTTDARDRMLVRMARYLRRHRADLPVLPTVSDQLRFLAGSGLDRIQRRSAMERLVPRYTRALHQRGMGPERERRRN